MHPLIEESATAALPTPLSRWLCACGVLHAVLGAAVLTLHLL